MHKSTLLPTTMCVALKIPVEKRPGDFDSSIEDVIQKLGGIQAQGIDCRNTICKAAYSVDEDFSSESSESEELDWQLMEKLLERSGGRRLDIRYANDSFGNRNMYIQLN